VDKHLADAARQAGAYCTFWFGDCNAVVDGREGRWSSWRNIDELLEEADVEDVV
jgi:hypothetical protein